MLTQSASPKLEAFYKDVLEGVAKLAREKYKDEPTVLHMVAGMSKAVGMLICACHPNERDLARATADANIDGALEEFAQGSPSPMTKQ